MTAIRGRVTDRSGKGIFNAHVIFTGPNGGRNVQQGAPTIGTVTDFDGYYEFVTLGGQYLTASHVGSNPLTKAIDFSNFSANGNYSQEINFTLGGGLTLPTFEVIEHRFQESLSWAKMNQGALIVAGAAAAAGIIFWQVSKKKKK